MLAVTVPSYLDHMDTTNHFPVLQLHTTSPNFKGSVLIRQIRTTKKIQSCVPTRSDATSSGGVGNQERYQIVRYLQTKLTVSLKCNILMLLWPWYLPFFVSCFVPYSLHYEMYPALSLRVSRKHGTLDRFGAVTFTKLISNSIKNTARLWGHPQTNTASTTRMLSRSYMD